MKRYSFFLFLFILFTIALQSPQQTSADTLEGTNLLANVQQHGTVRVIVELKLEVAFQPENTLASSQAITSQQAAINHTQQILIQRLASYNVTNVHSFATIPFVVMEVDETALYALTNDPAVSSIVEDGVSQLALSQSVPLIGGDVAWENGYTGAGWSVVVIDSGVESSHEFLQGKVVAEGCFSTSSYSIYPDGTFSSTCPNGSNEQTGAGAGAPCALPSCNHGTHVAGTIAGKGTTFSGVAPDATIISLQVETQINDESLCQKFTSTSAPCLIIFNSDVTRALEYAYQLRTSHNIAAINMSLGGDAYATASECDAQSKERKAIIDNLRAAGIPSIVASGNQYYTDKISSPACISSAISVGSTQDGSNGTTVDQVSRFSNSASFLDFLAPGESIYASVPGNTYGSMQGTSMATPHVAGAWAVMKSKTPTATIEQVYNGLYSTGKVVTDYRNGIAKPRIQLDAALNTLPNALEAPTNLQATLSSKTSVTLTWEDSNQNEDGFVVERWFGASWQKIGTTDKDVTTYTDDNTLTCEEDYYYRVAAVKGNDTSDYSEQSSITMPDCAVPGDCNEDENIDAGDLSAISLEISQSQFNSVGCDANRDGMVDVEDINCTISLIFGKTCQGPTVADLMMPHEIIEQEQPMLQGQNTETASPAPVLDPSLSQANPIIGREITNPIIDNTPTNLLVDTPYITLTEVLVGGELWGAVLTDYTFTAVISPDDTTLPITYTWLPEPKYGQGTTQATYDWQTPGRKTITISVTQAANPDDQFIKILPITSTGGYTPTVVQATHTITIMQDLYAIAPISATIQGATEGYPTYVYTMTAAVAPTSMTRPVTYTWNPTPLSGQGTLTATYRWDTVGTQTVGFSVTNRGGVISTTHSISLSAHLGRVAIAGNTEPLVGQEDFYTAILSPTSLLPITYTWSPEPTMGQGTGLVAFRWEAGGAKTLAVTVTNGFETITATQAISVFNVLEKLEILGKLVGRTHTLYTYIAKRTPTTTWLIPTIYRWEPTPLFGQGTPFALYRWSEPTDQTVKVMGITMFGDTEQETQTDSQTIQVADTPNTPLLTLPEWQYTAANSTVDIPITFRANGEQVSSIVFSLDYDEDLLVFDPFTSGTVSFGDIYTEMSSKYLFDITDNDGELDISITDRSVPLTALADNDMLATIRFHTRTPPTDGTLAHLRLSHAPLASFGNTNGASVTGNGYDGSVFIEAEDRPVIGLPPHVIATEGKVTVPVTVIPHDHAIGKVRFVLDYDESLLQFDGSDTNDDGIPDTITMTNGISGSVIFDANANAGELVFEVASEQALQAGDIAHITFDVIADPDSPLYMTVKFAQDDLPTFITVDGEPIVGVINGGGSTGTLVSLGKTAVYLPLVQKQ
jgi:subtilisin family serine protease